MNEGSFQPGYVDSHRVYATTASGTFRVSDDLSWNAAQWEWNRLDELRRAGYMPHVKFFEVRSVDDATPRFVEAKVNAGLLRVTLKQRGYGSAEAAARAAWRHLYGDRFHVRAGVGRSIESDEPGERTGVQGRGGWFYYPNGTVAAQGRYGLEKLARRMGLFVNGLDGRYYVLDADAGLDRPTVESMAARKV